MVANRAFLRRAALAITALAVLALASSSIASAMRITTCSGPESDNTNEDCNLVLYSQERYEVICNIANWFPYKGAIGGAELCPGMSELGADDVTGMCAVDKLVTADAYFGAETDSVNNTQLNGKGLVFQMPDTIAEKKHAYTLCFDSAASPYTNRFLTTMVATTEIVDEDAAFAPSFVFGTLFFSAVVVGLVTLA